MKERDTESKAGGYRSGAGRPKGTGKYGLEETQAIRVPVSLVSHIENLLEWKEKKDRKKVHPEHPAHPELDLSSFDTIYTVPETLSSNPLPFYASRVAAGFPSPADDYIDNNLDLNQYLIKHPAATFFVRVEGNSMIGVGIHENDILVVDQSVKPTHGKVIIAVVNGELTVKTLKISDGKVTLLPENSRYAPIVITENTEFSIWGVVTNVIHAL